MIAVQPHPARQTAPVRRPRATLTVDVVICAYTEDRWDLLGAAVASVQRQIVKPSRIILSIDHNDALARRCLERWPAQGQVVEPRVEVIQNRYPGRLGSARNSAVERVSADVVAFLDDDAVADPGWLAALLAVYDETAAVAVGGAPLPRYETTRPSWFPPEYDWVFGCRYVGLPETRSPVRHLIGASMSARADALRKVGGFHSDNHDDMDLSHRIAARYGPHTVIFEPAALVHHFVPAARVTWRYFWRRCFFVNRGKVRAFADMASAGDLGAEIDFVRRLLPRLARRLGAGLSGDVAQLRQAAAALAGLGLAGMGHAAGKAQLRFGRAPESLTKGLQTSPQR